MITRLNSNDRVKQISTWKDNIPVFRVNDCFELNQMIGYARFLNADAGTVLFRGQDDLYPDLLPSAMRSTEIENKQNVDNLERNLASALSNPHFIKFVFSSNRGKSPALTWDYYQKETLESLFQHYGAKTRAIDFVDTVWPALWFAKNGSSDPNKNAYIFLYVADTEKTSIHGLYISDESITIDLRKAFSSLFLRPAAQHGWTVKTRKYCPLKYHLTRVVAVLEIPIKSIDEMLGTGLLLTGINFYPNPSIDKGYEYLLHNQKNSSIPNNHMKCIFSEGFFPE